MKFTLLIASLALTSGLAQATVIHNEAIDGDLSGDFANPNAFVFSSSGANTIIANIGLNGNLGATNGTHDADYFTFTLGAGVSLVSITLDSYVSTEDQSFLAFTEGSFSDGTFGGLDGAILFGPTLGNILGNASGPGGTPGLPTSLGPGTYTFGIQETADPLVDFQLTFNTIPEPSSSLLLGLAGLGLLTKRRRR